jgi:hypothetical protein
MKIKFLLLVLLICLSSCGNQSDIDNRTRFDIGEYKGYLVVDTYQEEAIYSKTNYKYYYYILKNDSQIIKVKVDKCFSMIYLKGDTIK